MREDELVSEDVIAALTAEADQVDEWVAGLDAAGWAQPTPALGWTVAHQIAHLSFIFKLAGTAASEPETFKAMTEAAAGDFQGAVNAALGWYLPAEPEELLARWRSERTDAIKALDAVPRMDLVPWLVRPLPAFVLASAGLMELFGHGQDIADTVGVQPVRTDGLKHLVLFATLTWDFGYQARNLPTPDTQFRFEITGPSGALWEFGPEDATDRISGPAVDFCQLVTRRRHHTDLEVVATGEEATRWLEIAQAYRGPAGDGRSPGQFRKA
jgi:enediyne biosynthesis protein E11